MAVNKSVLAFRRLTEELQQEIRTEAIVELNRQAEELATLIESIAPVAPVEGGELKTSVRVIPDQRKDTVVRVVAGGPMTTDKSGGKPYDYARAVEFGTVHMKAQPFFFPTYRLRKKKIIAAMKRRIRANIKKRSAE